jgi:hypothetical protein
VSTVDFQWRELIRVVLDARIVADVVSSIEHAIPRHVAFADARNFRISSSSGIDEPWISRAVGASMSGG